MSVIMFPNTCVKDNNYSSEHLGKMFGIQVIKLWSPNDPSIEIVTLLKKNISMKQINKIILYDSLAEKYIY